MNIHDYRLFFVVATAILSLLVASPALSRLLVFPRTEFFSEVWLLGPYHKAEMYPFNVSSNQKYGVFLGIGNHLGHCGYYMIQVKFRNQTESTPDIFNRTPSSLPALFNITAFVADYGVWEFPLVFSFNYQYELLSKVQFHSLTLNDLELGMTDYMIAWDHQNEAFSGDLIFELWIYQEPTNSFQYHERFVSLRLNMTG